MDAISDCLHRDPISILESKQMTTRDVERKIGNAMTASQLIDQLQNMDPDAPVFFVCDYGDYHHTQQALTVESVEEHSSNDLVESAYSQSGVALIDSEGKGWECQTEDCVNFGTQMNIPTCFTCGKPNVDESGETYNPDDEDDDVSVVVLG